MTFDEILEQVITLLKRQGRVSYSALKRRFDLDDDYLNDLKDELLYVHPVRDDEGRGLIWTGDTASGPAVVPQPAQPTQLLAAQQQPSPEVIPRVTASPPSDAERRQLTVMFCDLVESTALSGQLDPEEYREVVRAYQKVCSEVITRFDGHVAQLLGDGLLVYFGYPQAHEDDAQRAVRTGLGILDAMGELNQGLQQAKSIQLGVRLGIHTGLVVIGEMGEAGRQEQLALGEVPNIASRIEGLAAANTLVMSETTLRLIQGYFDCEALGEQTLRGVAQPLQVYRVLQESGARGRLDVAVTRGLTPLVGRESEVALLLERWEQAKAGHGQVVLLSGEAGIGKSRLVQMLKEHVTQEPHTRWECRNSEYYQNTALFPLVDLFQRLWRFEAHETPDAKLEKLEHTLSQYRLPLEESVPLFAPLLSLPVPEHAYPPLNLSPQRMRQRTLEGLVAILLEQAERHPVLFIVEDLHWTDPTTLELLNLLIDQIPTASILTVLTCRPTFQPGWSHRSYLTEITVNRLSQNYTERMTEQIVGGKRLPAEVLQQIIAKTDGVPLFVEEMTKAILESGYLKETPAHDALTGTLPALAIPATLHDSLMARLDKLMTGKGIAQLGATIGRHFSYALLQAVAQLNEKTLQEELHRLVEAEIVYQRGVPSQSTYVFKHALIQDAAYESLLKSTRQQYHQRIAQVLEERFPETTETQPELLAHHCTEAGLNEQAVAYWQRAGQKAIQRSANVEAIALLSKGLEQLKTLPDTAERALQELTLQRMLGVPLLATKGFAAPEVEHAYSRARALCEYVQDTQQVFPVLFGLWGFYLVRGELQTAQALAEQLLTVAQRQQDSALLLVGYFALGDTLYWRGELVPARTYLEQSIVLYDPQQHRDHAFRYGQDPGTSCLGYAACTLWLLGYPEQARRRGQEMLTRAQALSHTFSMAFAHNLAIRLYHFLRDWPTVLGQAEILMALASEQGFAQLFAGSVREQGAAWAAQGQVAQGMTQMRRAMTLSRTTGAVIGYPLSLARLAEVCGHAGEVEEGLLTLTEALTLVETNGDRVCEAELYRLKANSYYNALRTMPLKPKPVSITLLQ